MSCRFLIVAGFLGAIAAGPAFAEDEVASLLQDVKAVGKQGTGSPAARAAWDKLVAAGPRVDSIVESRDHHVVQREAAGFQAFHAGSKLGLLPGNRRSAHEHIIDPELLDASHSRFIVGSRSQADLRRVGAFDDRPRFRRRGHCRRGRQRRRSDRLHHASARKTRFHR